MFLILKWIHFRTINVTQTYEVYKKKMETGSIRKRKHKYFNGARCGGKKILTFLCTHK